MSLKFKEKDSGYLLMYEMPRKNTNDNDELYLFLIKMN